METEHTCPYPASGCTSPHCHITAARADERAAEREHKAQAGWWNVADTSNPDRRYSPLDPNHFPPEFGPFDTREQAEEFAAMRPAYVVVPPARGDQ